MAVSYNDGKWYGWNGGECPVHPETVVEIRLGDRYYENDDMKDKAAEWFWNVTGGEGIIAFRVIKEHREPREFWVCGGDAFDSIHEAETHCGNAADIIHVREVLE